MNYRNSDNSSDDRVYGELFRLLALFELFEVRVDFTRLKRPDVVDDDFPKCREWWCLDWDVEKSDDCGHRFYRYHLRRVR